MFVDVPFESYKIASTAFMFIINDNMNIDLLFPILYIKRHPTEQCRDYILGAKYRNYTRGTVSKKGYMKNTILAEMYTDRKLSIKINLNKIHVCGTKSIEDARYAAQIIVDHINDAYAYLRAVHNDTDKWLSVVDKYIAGEQIPDCDSILMKYLKGQESDYKDVAVYGTSDVEILRAQLHRIADVTNIPADICIIEQKINMLNYNYNVVNNLQGREDLLPSRITIIQSLLDVPHIVIEADNRLKQNIVLTIDVPADDGTLDRQKFIIHRNGKIAHSGHSIDMMKRGYQLLMSRLSTIDYSKQSNSKMKLSTILKEYRVEDSTTDDLAKNVEQLTI